MPANPLPCCRQSCQSGYDAGDCGLAIRGSSDHTIASRSGFRYGNGCQATCCSTLNSAVVAPIPIASESTAASANPGVRASVRDAVPQVERQLFQPLPAPDPPRVFRGQRHVAELLHHFGPRPLAVFALPHAVLQSPCRMWLRISSSNSCRDARASTS